MTQSSSQHVPEKDGVVAVLQDSAGRYLIIQRGWALKRAPGAWCFVGGEVEPGEALETAIVREVLEEVGLDVEAQKKVHESISPNGEYRLHWLRVRQIDPLQAPRPNPVEVADLRWLHPQEALALDNVLPGLRAWLKQI